MCWNAPVELKWPGQTGRHNFPVKITGKIKTTISPKMVQNDKYIIGNWNWWNRVMREKQNEKETHRFDYSFLLFVWYACVCVCVFSQESCLAPSPLRVYVTWLRFSWNSICGRNFTFLFPLDKYFSFTKGTTDWLALCFGKVKTQWEEKTKSSKSNNETNTEWVIYFWFSEIMNEHRILEEDAWNVAVPSVNRMSVPNALNAHHTKDWFVFKQRTQSLDLETKTNKY